MDGFGANYECLFFDMDDTLYPLSIGINLACRNNIQEFMLNQLGIEESEVPKLCLDLYKEYGTTMAGLKVTYFKILDLKHSLRKLK
jgi:pyrimidine 5'-nucleotidase